MKKTMYTGLLAIILVFSLVVAGCGKQLTVKETMAEALEASMNMKSYSFDSKVSLELNMPEALLAEDPSSAMMLTMLNQSELNIHGIMHQEPEMQAEVTLDIAIKGDMTMNISVPMVITTEKMWVKIPNIPMLAGLIPEELSGKFIELDYEQLNEMSGSETAFDPGAMDLETQQKLSMEMYGVLTDHFEEETYFTVADAKNATLPDNVDAKQVITFSVDDSNLEPAIETLITKALPQLLDVMAKPEYAEMLQFNPEDIEQMKEDLKDSESTLQEDLAEVKENLKINEFTLTSALDKDSYMTYQKLLADITFEQDGESIQAALTADMTLSDINKDPEFKIGIPTGDQVVTMNQLMEYYGGMGLGF